MSFINPVDASFYSLTTLVVEFKSLPIVKNSQEIWSQVAFLRLGSSGVLPLFFKTTKQNKPCPCTTRVFLHSRPVAARVRLQAVSR
jgi:hypothetical protein